jgi:hypothetical protein
MNERILELADKAIEDMPGAWNIPDEFCKKFAELIVKECAHVGFNAAYPDKGVVVLTAIKQHFGVKE